MYISFLNLVLIASYCGFVSAVIQFCASTCIFRNKAIKAKWLWQKVCILDKVTCAVECMWDSQCLTFSYSRSEGICRGYSNNVEYYTDMLKNVKGNTVFRTCRAEPSHGSMCKQNRDCRIKKSVCYGGVCLCELGLYFSPKQNACLQECTEFGDGMDIYKGASIELHNDKELYNTTLSSCCDLCVQEKTYTCLTVDWDRRNGKCCLSQTGYLDVPVYHREHDLEYWMFAQRRCK